MSNRRPPRVDPPPATATDPGTPGEAAAGASLPSDAASLGYADLAEHPPGAELPAFRELRARLFADIELATADSDFDPTDQPDHSAAPERPALFLPTQFSIANGARTAAEIADDDPAEPDSDSRVIDAEIRWPLTALIDASPIETETEDAEVADAEPIGAEVYGADGVDSEPATVAGLPLDIAGQAVDVDEDLTATPAVDSLPSVAPAAALGAGALQPTLPTLPAPTSTIEDEPASRRTPVLVLLAAFVVVSLIGGWALLTRNDDQGANSVDAVASAATRMQSVAVATIDADSVRATQRLEFDDTVSMLRLRVPQRGNASAIADFKPTVDSIEIAVAGQPIQRITDRLTSGEDITIDLDHPSDSITLTYVAEGAIVRTEPSSAHRAKAWMTPLRVGAAEGSARLLTVQGPDVLNIGCAERSATVACGQQTDDGWTVEPGAATNVIAQVDLPE